MRKFLSALLITTALIAPAALGQSAALLPNGMQQFADQNGAPYANGKVYFYVPNSTTPKETWVDPNQATPNPNPVTLDGAGRAVIYGTGQYRQQLYDQFGTLIWDKLTAVSLQAQGATNVISEGADPTGANDSAPAFQSAFDTCSVYIPAGTYKITFGLNTGNCKYISYVGAGSGVVDIINATADQTSFTNNANGGDFTGMTWDRAVAAVGSNAVGLNFAAATDYMNLYDVISKNSNPGIWLGVAEYSVAQNVIASENYGDGFFITDSFISGEAQWTLLNVLSQENNGWGYDVRALGSTILQLVQWTNVSSFANNNGGILLDGTSTTNRIEGFTLTNGQLNTDGGDEIQMKTYAFTPILISNTQISLAGTGPTGRLLGTPASNIGFGMDLGGTQVRLSIVQSILAQNSQGGLECNPGTVTDSLELIGDVMELNGTTSPGIGASLACTPISTVVTGGSYGNRTGSSNQAYGLTISNGNGVSLEGVNVPANTTAGISITSNANLAFCFGIQGESMVTIGCDYGAGGGGPASVSLTGGTNISVSPNPITGTGSIATVSSPTFSNVILPNNGNIDLGGTAILSGNGTGVSLTGSVANGFGVGMGIAPNPTNTYPLGLSTNRWSDVETNNATVAGVLTTGITGSTQCLHANSAGVVSGTGADCGSGSGGLSPIADSSVLGNTTGATAVPVANSINAILDYQMGNPAPVGSLALRGTGAWTDLAPGAGGAVLTGGSTGAPTWLAAGTSGQVLSSNGAGAAPSWITPAGGSSAVSSVTGSGAVTVSPTTGATVVSLTSISDSNIVANASGISAAPVGTNFSTFVDHATSGSTVGNLFTRNSVGWGITAPGSAGQVLTAHGAGAALTWTTPASAPVSSVSGVGAISVSPTTGAASVFMTSVSDSNIIANASGASGAPAGINFSTFLDHAFGSTTVGNLVTRNSTGWGYTAPGAANSLLMSNGSGSLLSWTTSPTVSGLTDTGNLSVSGSTTHTGLATFNGNLTVPNGGIFDLSNTAGTATVSSSGGTVLNLHGSFSIGINTPTFGPATDNATTNGASGDRWTAVWATNGTIQTSDEREKKNIEDSNLGLDFIDHLRPVSFEWKEGKLADGRRHYGLIAQQMEVVLGSQDFGGLHRPANDNERYGLNYDELVAPLIKAVQQLSAENKELHREVQDLDYRLRHQGRGK